MEFGGCAGLSIPDYDKLNSERALSALAVLWPGAAGRVLDLIPRDGSETGATFTACSEDFAEFEKLLTGSGIEANLLMPPPPRAVLKELQELDRG